MYNKTERAYLRYRRAVVENWPESAVKKAHLEAIAHREAILEMAEAIRALAAAGEGGCYAAAA